MCWEAVETILHAVGTCQSHIVYGLGNVVIAAFEWMDCDEPQMDNAGLQKGTDVTFNLERFQKRPYFIFKNIRIRRFKMNLFTSKWN